MTTRGSDKEYWDEYYSRFPDPFEPSPFALHVADQYLDQNVSLLELGCGNGRDAVFLSSKCRSVTAVDQCDEELQLLNRQHGYESLSFVTGDITDPGGVEGVDDQQFSCVYSRFSLHAVPKEGQDRILDWACTALPDGGLLLLEFRGLGNELMGRGQAIGDDGVTFLLDGHARRFVDAEAVAGRLKRSQMDILKLDESTGFSPTASTDETFVRLVSQKVGH